MKRSNDIKFNDTKFKVEIPKEEEIEDEEEDIISEKVNLDMIKYDFDNLGKNILIDENNNNNKNTSQTNVSKENDSNREKDNNNDNENIENEINTNKTEEISRKYKITNLGKNIMKLPDNYSTDDEDEYKFINLLNESNDSYELAVDSKKIKVYSKIVSIQIIYNIFIINFILCII